MIGWVFFRVEQVGDALLYLQRMFAFNFTPAASFDGEFYLFLLLAVFFSFFTIVKKGELIQNSIYFDGYNLRRHLLTASLVVMLLTLCISSITAFGFNPFIYFRF
jgi:alginate O-acetyltransferase complex protein AlgI